MLVESSELMDDLVRDMIEVLTSFCARLYGNRSARRQAKKAMRAIGNKILSLGGSTGSERICALAG
jgi:predicted site-specific integrase-resolvase